MDKPKSKIKKSTKVKDVNDLVSFSEEELHAIAQRLMSEGDFDSDLARAIFTVQVIGVEYHNCYEALEAYSLATEQAFRDYASASANAIGLKDIKKIQEHYKMGERFAAGITERVMLHMETIAETSSQTKDE